MRPKSFGARLGMALGLFGLVVLPAQRAYADSTTTFTSSGSITINDETFNNADSTYHEGTATPYPSDINVTGTNGTVKHVIVSLNGLTHPSLQDLEVLLVGPGGVATILFAGIDQNTDPAQLSVSNYTLKFADGAQQLLCGDLPLSGTIYAPAYCPNPFYNNNTAGVQNDYFPPPAPAKPARGGPAGGWPLSLGQFNGTSANGVWHLFVLDNFLDMPADTGTIASWSLTITTTGVAPTISRVSRFRAQHSGTSLRFSWVAPHTANLAGFNLYAGAHRLNHRVIATHAASRYTFQAPYTAERPLTLHVLLRNGTEQVVTLH